MRESGRLINDEDEETRRKTVRFLKIEREDRLKGVSEGGFSR